MTMKAISLAALIAVVATASVAHKGATGMLLERMQAMLAMGKATKAITPMMRGQQGYDADRTRDYAAVLQTHSGDAMLNLFPEGMNAKPSVAKDAVWIRWEEFSALANELSDYAVALDQAAENGLGDAAPAAGSMMGGDTTGMMGSSAATNLMMGGTVAAEKSVETLALLPANALFAQAAQVCSACHTQFRVEE